MTSHVTKISSIATLIIKFPRPGARLKKNHVIYVVLVKDKTEAKFT